MDDLTRERFGEGVPYHEAHRRPTALGRVSKREISRRRIELCGTDSLDAMVGGGDTSQVKNRRLLKAIQRWSA